MPLTDTVRHMKAELAQLEAEGAELSTRFDESEEIVNRLSSKKRKLDRLFRSISVDVLESQADKDGEGSASHTAYMDAMKHYGESTNNLINAMKEEVPIVKAMKYNKEAIGKKNREIAMALGAISAALKKD